MRKTLAILILTLSVSIAGLCQTKISGTVKDQSGNPVPFATVNLKGTKVTVAADANANFIINAKDGDVLTISAVGLQNIDVTVSGNSVSVTMVRTTATISDVIVTTALGIQRQKDKLATSESNVKGSEIIKSGETSVLQGLSGKASGVQVVRSTGDPGAGAYIQIRGQSTITGNLQPLFVVDGIPVSNSSLGNTVAQGTAQQSRISDINPNDIVSVDILKGAAAAVLYGSRAANGVVLITTKKGKASANKINISLTSTYSLDEINKSVPLQTAYGGGSGGIYGFGSRTTWGDKISERKGGKDDVNTNADYVIFPDGTKRFPISSGTADNPHGGKNSKEVYDHAKELFRNGHFFDNSISLSGGDDKTQFYASFENNDQEGILKEGSDYHRHVFNFNGQRKFGSAVTLGTNFIYSNIRSNRVQQGSNLSGIFLGGLRTSPDFDNTQYKGTYVDAAGALFPDRQVSYRNPIGKNVNSGYDNPFWIINEITSNSRVNRFLGSFEANVTATSWLSFLLRTGIDYYSDDRTDNYPVLSSVFQGGDLTIQENSEQQFNTDLLAQFKTPITSDINFDGFIGLNYNDRLAENIGADVKSFILPGAPFNLQNSAGAARTPFNSNSEFRTTAANAQLNFTAYDQLILNLTGRAERPSTVSETFYFPSASLAWLFTKLPGLQNGKVLSFGKIRGSYGEVGVEPTPYLNATYYVGAAIGEAFGPALDASSDLYGGGYIRNTLKGNPNLKPERKKEVEGGLDLRFFSDKVRLSGTYYSNKTIGALLPVQVPATTGFISQYDNAATIRNKGVELDLGINWYRSRNADFSISTDVNWSQNRNKVLSLNGTKQIGLSGFVGVISSAVPNYALGVFWGVGYDRDEKGSLILDDNGFPTVAPSESVLGDPNPDWTGAVNTTLTYKHFSFSFLFDHVQGGQVWNGTRGALTYFGTAASTGFEAKAGKNLTTYYGGTIDAGTTFRGAIEDFGAGPVALTQEWYQDIGGGFGTATGPQFFEDGTRTRLREISIGYSLTGENFRAKTKLQSIDFSFTGRNLVLWADYKGIDPETNLEGPSNGRGIDYFNNPSTRSYLFTIRINY